MQFLLKLRTITVVKCEKKMSNNPNLDLIYMDAYIYITLVQMCENDVQQSLPRSYQYECILYIIW